MMTSSRKVFDVLEYLCQYGPSRANEVSGQLGLQKSSSHRFLNALVAFGYAAKNELSAEFCPTLKIARLGILVGNRIDMAGVALPHMRRLAADFGLTVGLGTLMDQTLIVLRREYPRDAVPFLDMNQQLPAYCTGMGKALLSVLDEAQLDVYIASMPRIAFTPRTLVDGKALKENVLDARRKGYAEERGEICDGLHCVSVPIVSPHRRAWSISVSGHFHAVAGIGVPRIVERLRHIARTLTTEAPSGL